MSQCLFWSILHHPNVCTQRDAQAHDHDETHNSHVRAGALTIHHPDWMDRHPGGSRQDTHGTLVHSQARHRVYLHNMVAEHDTTHWCQNGRPTRRLAGEHPRTVTSETLVACGEHVETRRTSQKTTGGRDQTARLTRLTTSKTKLEEASTDGSAHSSLDRNVSQV